MDLFTIVSKNVMDGFVYNCVKKRQLMFLPCSRIGERKLLQKPENFVHE